MNRMTASFSGDPSSPENKHLGNEEVRQRLASLTAGELRKLRLIEARHLAGTDFSPRMLYQEAVCRVILGERNCPRDEAFIAVLANMMKSIASHRRRQLKRQVELAEGHEIATDQLDPEQMLIERESSDLVTEIYALFEGDDEAQLTIMAFAEGDKKGKELRAALGVDQAGFDYIKKRIKRVVAKKYPKGWPL
jgi:DNA-directed RNA polymerase specialized sigma24 family protein